MRYMIFLIIFGIGSSSVVLAASKSVGADPALGSSVEIPSDMTSAGKVDDLTTTDPEVPVPNGIDSVQDEVSVDGKSVPKKKKNRRVAGRRTHGRRRASSRKVSPCTGVVNDAYRAQNQMYMNRTGTMDQPSGESNPESIEPIS